VSERLPERVVESGGDEYLEAAWTLKERIRRDDGVLAQRRGFFVTQYRRAQDYLVLGDEPDRLAGFGVVRPDGYLSMLGVAPEHRRSGVASRLVGRMAADHERVTCHTRAGNEPAVSFYTDLGFTVEKRVENYYRDGDDAYLLALVDGSVDLMERLTEML
jgi:ribosomal protein S18 acetylase RimI-like enzyme